MNKMENNLRFNCIYVLFMLKMIKEYSPSSQRQNQLDNKFPSN